MDEEVICSTKNYKIVKGTLNNASGIYIFGKRCCLPLIENSEIYPRAYALAFFAEEYKKGRAGFPSDMSNWSKLDTQKFEPQWSWLHKRGLLDNGNKPTEELLELGKYVLPLISQSASATKMRQN